MTTVRHPIEIPTHTKTNHVRLCSSSSDSPLPADEFSPAARAAAGRYGSQVSVFGSSFQKQLEELNVFLVGSGALGSIARLSPCYMHMHHAHAT